MTRLSVTSVDVREANDLVDENLRYKRPSILLLLLTKYRLQLSVLFCAVTLAGAVVVSTAAIRHSPLLLYGEDDSLMSVHAPPNFTGVTTRTSSEEIDFVAHVYVMPCLLFLGLINQCLNVWTLSSLPSIGFLYLKASAIADILSIFALIPFCIRHSGLSDDSNYYIMFYHAYLELPVINSLITASAHCLVAMTIDRWLSINYPIVFHNSPGSKTRIRNVIFLIYLCAFLTFSISCWQKKLVETVFTSDSFGLVNATTRYAIERNHEISQKPYFKVYLMFREIFARIGPIFVLVVLNLDMIRSLRKLSARYSRRSMRAGRTRDQDRVRISVLLLITSATFVVCTLPASILSIFIDSSFNGIGMQIFRAFANCLQVSHYLPHLYLYMLCSTEYRLAFYKVFGCTKARSSQTTADSPTFKLSSTVIARVRTSIKYLPAPLERRVRSIYGPNSAHSIVKYSAPKKTSTTVNNHFPTEI